MSDSKRDEEPTWLLYTVREVSKYPVEDDSKSERRGPAKEGYVHECVADGFNFSLS